MKKNNPTGFNLQVDDAVERLLSWNDKSKTQAEAFYKRLHEVGQFVGKNSTEISGVADHADQMIASCQKVEQHLEQLDTILKNFAAMHEDIAEMLQPISARFSHLDVNAVSFLSLLARAVIDQQTQLSAALAQKASAFRAVSDSVVHKLEMLSQSAKSDVVVLEHALIFSSLKTLVQDRAAAGDPNANRSALSSTKPSDLPIAVSQ